jgi:glyoxylase-like metal-dependent hydrolase (beta-lactamase superfamily II)
VRRLREVAPGVLVATSSFELTTTTVVVGSGGCLLIDPAVTVAELARLAADLRELGQPPAAAVRGARRTPAERAVALCTQDRWT